MLPELSLVALLKHIASAVAVEGQRMQKMLNGVFTKFETRLDDKVDNIVIEEFISKVLEPPVKRIMIAHTEDSVRQQIVVLVLLSSRSFAPETLP